MPAEPSLEEIIGHSVVVEGENWTGGGQEFLEAATKAMTILLAERRNKAALEFAERRDDFGARAGGMFRDPAELRREREMVDRLLGVGQ